MLVEKNTFGQRPVWTSAFTSVPTAPASSGLTSSQEPVGKPGVEIWEPACVASALLWTCQPPSPTILVSADAADVPIAASPTSVIVNRGRQQRATRDTVVLPIRQSSNQIRYTANTTPVKSRRAFDRTFSICRGSTNYVAVTLVSPAGLSGS